MAYKKLLSSAKKGVRKAGKQVKKRYFKGKGYKNPKFFQMAKDLDQLKTLLNVEKKKFIIEEREPINIGLLTNVNKTSTLIDGETIYTERNNVNFSGAYVKTNLTGTPTRGVGDNHIVGDRIKVVSYHMDYRVKAIESTNSAIIGWTNRTSKIHLYLIVMPRADQVLTNDITAENEQEVLLQRFFEPSVFDATYDGTRRNIQFKQDFKVLGKKTLYVKHSENLDSHTDTTRNDFKFEGKMGGKLDDCHMRWDGNQLIKNQFAMIAISIVEKSVRYLKMLTDLHLNIV